MKEYKKPIIMVNSDVAEGVYAASGCYDIKISGHQYPEAPRLSHKFQFDGKHKANELDGHYGSAQRLNITFDKPVNHISGGTLVSGDGTCTLVVSYSYTQNPSDNIGLGDLEVSVVGNPSDPELNVTAMWLECNGIQNW